MNRFMILDIILGIATVYILIITHVKVPKNISEVKPRHHFLVNSWVLFHVLWTTGISIVESSTNNSVPTLLVGIFSAATIYLIRGLFFFIFLILSFLTLIFGLYHINHISIDILISQYVSIVVLYALAWIVSRILFNTRKKSFYENKNLEIAKNNLDKTVKERTQELSNTNKTLRDEINERKRYAKSVEAEKKRAEEADRLKSVFLANMSHEIRTPLNGILGFGDLLQNPNLSEEKKTRYLKIINTNSQRLLKLIDDIMDISMIESNQLRLNNVSFRLSNIFSDVLIFFENFKRLNDKEHIKIINEGFPENVNDNVNLDPTRVQQVLYNLLSNAIKFTEKGTIRFGGKYDNAYALIYVEDTGIGIDPDKCHAVFQRFRQGEESISRKFGGTGLGLSISKGIVELLGGMIWVDLSYTKGTRICLSLPTEEIIEPDKSITSLENIKLLDKRCLVVTHTNNTSQGALTPILKCAENSCVFKTLNNYYPETIKSKYELVILDIPDKKTELLKCIQSTVTAFNHPHIIAIASKNDISTEILVKAGCSLVMDTPVNIQVFLLYVRGLIS
ncbi:MAG: hypothetical protein JXB24_02275 [Bacteroidales bacterium]|nr:hypothetical protein [Bacteroidales bacterium]